MSSLKSTLRAIGHTAMAPLELTLRKANTLPTPPPIFIIGAPRSGTTLAYEAVATAYKVAFISNAAHRFYQTPLAATWIFRTAIQRWQGDYTNRLGHIEGWAAPNEGGWIWRRWLPDGDWTDGSALSANTRDELREFTSAMSSILSGPFLNKNVMHSNRLQLMNLVWPDARFVVVERDLFDNARSIVRAFRNGSGPQVGPGVWRSVRPRLAPEWDNRSLPARAVAQVSGVGADVARDMKIVGPERLFRLSYTDLCKRPAEVLKHLHVFLAATGGAPQRRATNLPPEFSEGGSKFLAPDLEREMRIALADLQRSSAGGGRADDWTPTAL